MGETVKYAVVLDDKMSAALKTLGITADKVDDEMRKLISDAGGLTQAEAEAAMAVREQNKQLEAKARLLGVSTSEVKQLEASQKSLSVSYAAVTSAIAGMVAGMARLIKQSADLRNKFNDLAVETGFAASTLQALDLGARSGGDSLEQLVPSLRAFSKRMQDAAYGLETAQRSFDKLGVSVTNTDGTLRAADDVMRDIAKAIEGVENPTERAAIMSDLFGRSGGKLLKVMGSGTDALDAYSKKAAALGIDLESGSKGAAKLQISLADLETKLLGTADAIVQMLGGEGGAAKAIDNFILGFTFVEEIILSLARNWGNFIELFLDNLTMIPRAIKAAIQGESIVDELVQPFKDFANDIENPLNNAIEKVKAVIAARDELSSALGGPTLGEGGGGGGGGFGAATETQFVSSAAPLTAGQLKAAQQRLADFANEYGAEVVHMVEVGLGTSIGEIQAAIGETTDVEQLADIVAFVGDFEDALKKAVKTVDDRNKADEDAAKAAKDLATAQQEAFDVFVQAREEQRMRAAGAIGTVAGGAGGITSAIGAAGPIGAGIAAGIGLTQQLATAKAGEGPLAEIAELPTVIAKGLSKLGPELSKALTTLLTEAVPELIKVLPDVLIDLLFNTIPAVQKAIYELLGIIISDVIPDLAQQLPDSIEMLFAEFIPAALRLIPDLAKALLDPKMWRNTIVALQEAFGRALGLAVSGILDLGAKLSELLQTIFANAFNRDFWRQVLQSIIDAIRGFEFNNVALDAFRQTAGFSGGGPTGLQGLAERAGDRFGGGGDIIFNGLGFGDDRAVLKRIRDKLSSGRTGVSF